MEFVVARIHFCPYDWITYLYWKGDEADWDILDGFLDQFPKVIPNTISRINEETQLGLEDEEREV